ncbi:hypothetical protein TanjilG_21878 [Lupinus angustifolius]|nr:hypothetical protein TanjilG_21878 [Lupinus angustifolius]
MASISPSSTRTHVSWPLFHLALRITYEESHHAQSTPTTRHHEQHTRHHGAWLEAMLHSTFRIPLVRASSESTVRRPGKRPHRTRSQSIPRSTRGDPLSPREQLKLSTTADKFGTGTPVPSTQSQSFSRGYRSILPTSLAYIVPSTRGCSPWRPDAVMSTTGRGRHSVLRIFKGRRGRTGHHATCGALPAAGPYLRLSRFQVSFTWNLSPLRPSKFSFEYLLLPPRSAPTTAPPGLTPQVSAQLGTVTQLPVHPASPVLLTKNGPLGALDSVAWLNKAATPSYLFKNSPAGSSYPEGNFGGNQLLDGSISLSPLYPSQTNDLHVCSHSNPSQKIRVGRRCNPQGDPTNQLPCALRVYLPADSHTCQTPWSVFQDGPNGEPAGRRPEHAGAEAHQTARASNHNRDDDVSTSMSTARAWATMTIRVVFSLGRNLPPDWGCIPKQPDSPTAPRGATGSGHDGALTLSGAPFQGTWARSAAEDASPDYNSDTEGDRFSWRPTDPHGSKSRKAGGGDTHDRSRALAQPPSITAPSTADSVFNQPRALGLMASGATCVQRLDGSRDSAIHTKYRISLRSSSMQEPRYPLPRVFRISVSQRRPHEHRLRADGGELNDFNFLGAFRAGVLLLGQEDTAEGSPTETLLRLLLPLNDKVQWTSHNVAGSEPPTSPQSEHFTGPFNRPQKDGGPATLEASARPTDARNYPTRHRVTKPAPRQEGLTHQEIRVGPRGTVEALDASPTSPTCPDDTKPKHQPAPGRVRPGFGMEDGSVELPTTPWKNAPACLGQLAGALGGSPMACHPDPPRCRRALHNATLEASACPTDAHNYPTRHCVTKPAPRQEGLTHQEIRVGPRGTVEVLDASPISPTCPDNTKPKHQPAPGRVRPGFGMEDDSVELPTTPWKNAPACLGQLAGALGGSPMACHPDPPRNAWNIIPKHFPKLRPRNIEASPSNDFPPKCGTRPGAMTGNIA